MHNILLNDMIKMDTNDFFTQGKEDPDVVTALDKVLNKEADCMMVTLAVFVSLKEVYYPRVQKVVPIESFKYPPALIIGKKENIERLESGLWARLQNAGISLIDTPDGKKSLHLFYLDHLGKPTKDLLTFVRTFAADHSVELLPVK
jgi:hypothetical protein